MTSPRGISAWNDRRRSISYSGRPLPHHRVPAAPSNRRPAIWDDRPSMSRRRMLLRPMSKTKQFSARSVARRENCRYQRPHSGCHTLAPIEESVREKNRRSLMDESVRAEFERRKSFLDERRAHSQSRGVTKAARRGPKGPS